MQCRLGWWLVCRLSTSLVPGIRQLGGQISCVPLLSVWVSLGRDKTNRPPLEYTAHSCARCLDQHSSSPCWGERSSCTRFTVDQLIPPSPHCPVTMVLSQRQRDELWVADAHGLHMKRMSEWICAGHTHSGWNVSHLLLSCTRSHRHSCPVQPEHDRRNERAFKLFPGLIKNQNFTSHYASRGHRGALAVLG